MKVRRLLAVSPHAPWPLTNGMTLRRGNLLQALGERVEGVLVAPTDAVPDLERWVPASFRLEPFETRPASPDRSPFRILGKDLWPYEFDPAPIGPVLSRLRQAGETFDAVLAWPGAEGPITEHYGPPSCYDLVDVRSASSFRRFANALDFGERRRAFADMLTQGAWESIRLRHLPLILVAGSHDRASLRRRRVKGRVEIVPNGVDLDFFEPRPEGRSATPTAVFTGTLSYQPNVYAAIYAAEEVWPLVREQIPDARLLIVGREPARRVRALAELAGVEVVPDVADIRDPMAEAWMALAPMWTGTGIKNKILEAWAMELPVVTTPLGTNGMEASFAEIGFVAEDPGQFAERTVELLRDPEAARRHGRDARRTCVKRHSWGAAADRVLELLAETS